MKRITFLLGSVLLAMVTITLSSFMSKSFKNKAFTQTCYYYTANNRRVAPGTSGQSNLKENSLDETLFKTAGSWSSTASTSDCDALNYLCAICFTLDENSDGDNANGLTLSEALNIAWSYYVAQTPDNFPTTNGANVNTGMGHVTDVNIWQQSTANSNH